MENIFRIDGWFFKAGLKTWHLLTLNLCILLASLPLFTIGAAQTAGFVVVKRMIEVDESKIVSTFIRAFKENLKKSTLLWGIIAGIFYFLWLDWQFILVMNQSIFVLVGVAIVSIMALNLFQYGFFYQAIFKDTIKQTLKNTVKLLIKKPVSSLFLLFLMVGPYILMGVSSYLLIFGIYIHLFVGISFQLYIRTFILLNLFKSQLEKEDTLQ